MDVEIVEREEKDCNIGGFQSKLLMSVVCNFECSPWKAGMFITTEINYFSAV